MSIYLKLTGLETYASKSLGVIKRNQIVEIEDEELADRLLEKGTLIGNEDDTFLKPHFVEVAAPRPAARPRRQSDEELEQESRLAEEELKRRLSAVAPQAPVGPGPNGAENDEGPEEGEYVEEGAQDPAYHEPADGGEGLMKEEESSDPSDVENEEQSGGQQASNAEKPATAAPAKVTRQRAPKAPAK